MFTLLNGPAGLSVARSELRRVCRDHRIATERSQASELVLSELVGNAVRHGRLPIAYATVMDSGDVLILVDDAEPSPPVQRRDANRFAEAGRGLLLVTAMARSWGWEEKGVGKRVWARV